MQVLVRDNNIEQALRVLKKKMQREGVFREMKARKSYEKPSEKRVREKAEAIRRSRKAARKQAQRDGLLPAPKKKVMPNAAARPARPASGSASSPVRAIDVRAAAATLPLTAARFGRWAAGLGDEA